MSVRWIVAAVVVAGCADQRAEPGGLAQDRVIAVRATPPRLVPGERAVIDVLSTSVEGGPVEGLPSVLTLSPSTTDALSGVIDGVEVVCPDDGLLAAARVELGLDADAPVPLTVLVALPIAGDVRTATKTVWFGDVATNPVIAEIRIAGDLVAPTELELSIDATEGDEVDWLTSRGEVSEVGDAVAHLQVDEPGDVTVVVVLRDDRGGVAWRIETIEIFQSSQSTSGGGTKPWTR